MKALLPFPILLVLLGGFVMMAPKCREATTSNIQSGDRNLPTDSVFFMLKRTPCFGRCPVYEFRLYGDGRLIYEGRHFVENEGVFEGKVEETVFQSILSKAIEVNYFSFSEKYPEDSRLEITDAASVVTALNTGKKKHKVVNKGIGAPEGLKNFEQYTDSLLKTIDLSIVKPE